MRDTAEEARTNLLVTFSYEHLYIVVPMLVDQQRLTYISYVQTQDAA